MYASLCHFNMFHVTFSSFVIQLCSTPKKRESGILHLQSVCLPIAHNLFNEITNELPIEICVVFFCFAQEQHKHHFSSFDACFYRAPQSLCVSSLSELKTGPAQTLVNTFINMVKCIRRMVDFLQTQESESFAVVDDCVVYIERRINTTMTTSREKRMKKRQQQEYVNHFCALNMQEF